MLNYQKVLFFNNHFHYVMVIPGHIIYVFRSWFLGLSENNQPKSNGWLDFFRLSQFLFLIFWVNGLVPGKIYRKAPYFIGKSMVSCKLSLKPIHGLRFFLHVQTWKKKQEAFPDGLHFREPCPAAQPGHRSRTRHLGGFVVNI